MRIIMILILNYTNFYIFIFIINHLKLILPKIYEASNSV